MGKDLGKGSCSPQRLHWNPQGYFGLLPSQAMIQGVSRLVFILIPPRIGGIVNRHRLIQNLSERMGNRWIIGTIGQLLPDKIDDL